MGILGFISKPPIVKSISGYEDIYKTGKLEKPILPIMGRGSNYAVTNNLTVKDFLAGATTALSDTITYTITRDSYIKDGYIGIYFILPSANNLHTYGYVTLSVYNGQGVMKQIVIGVNENQFESNQQIPVEIAVKAGDTIQWYYSISGINTDGANIGRCVFYTGFNGYFI